MWRRELGFLEEGGRRSGNGGGFRERKWWKLEERERMNGSEEILEGGLCEIESVLLKRRLCLKTEERERERYDCWCK